MWGGEACVTTLPQSHAKNALISFLELEGGDHSRDGRGGGGGTHLLLAFASWPLTTHPSRDVAPFLLLIETPLNIWALIAFFSKHYIKTLWGRGV